MDKETLSNYGWIVICVLVLAVMIALAGPFGTFVAGAVKSTTAGLFGVNQNALGAAGIEIGDQVFENCDHLETEIRNATDTYTGDTCCKACGAVMSAGQTVRAKVPEGGKYTAADGTVYNPGDEMPEVVTDGDTYTDGEYMYKYNYYGTAGNSSYWYEDTTQNGWGVIWIKYSGMPAPVKSSINGKPLTTMHQTFYGKNGLSADMSSYIIPNTVTSVSGIFAKSNLQVSPVIPEGVVNMHSAFYETALRKSPVIPSTVTNMQSTFLDCTQLTDDGLPVIPSGVTNMFQTFMGCTSITTAPVIPENVEDAYSIFEGCTSLSGTIVINATPTRYGESFQYVDMSKITLAGSCSSTVKQRMANSGINGSQVTIID